MKHSTWPRRIAFTLLGCVTLLLLATVVENVRGKRAFLAYQRQLEARGETLDWRRLVPPPVPDEENFATTPLLAPLLDYTRNPATGENVHRIPGYDEQLKGKFGWRRDFIRAAAWRQGEFADLAAAQHELRGATNATDPRIRELQQRPLGPPAEDLLFLLGTTQAELDEIRVAVKRPHAVFPVHYAESLDAVLPHLAVLKTLATAFQTKALAELDRQRPEPAADEVETILALSETLRREPLLISGLVRIAILELAAQPLWEGIARHQWNDAQLARFQERLARQNLIADAQNTLRGERAFGITAIAFMKRNADRLGIEDSNPFGPFAGLLKHAPSGWTYQNQLAVARAYEDLALPLCMPEERRINLELQRRADAEVDNRLKSVSPYTVFARMLVPSVCKTVERAARTQATVTLGAAACALERHRLAHGSYPENLDALIPALMPALPGDPATGQPLRYRRDPDGAALVYSVGLDGEDHRGTVLFDKRGRVELDKPGSDWVWRLPAP